MSATVGRPELRCECGTPLVLGLAARVQCGVGSRAIYVESCPACEVPSSPSEARRLVEGAAKRLLRYSTTSGSLAEEVE